LGISLPLGAVEAFQKYAGILENQGRYINLTAIKNSNDVAHLHFLDSISLLKFCDFSTKCVIDVGSGAGFPGIPLKIVDNSINLTLLEATGKKVAFLSGLCDTLSIEANYINARAEEVSSEPDKRERFDITVSRAVARLNILCELCLPLTCVGGMFIAMKSIDSTEELTEARTAINKLGGELLNYHDYTIPYTTIIHRAVLIRKKSTTPAEYPRRYAKIKKAPL